MIGITSKPLNSRTKVFLLAFALTYSATPLTKYAIICVSRNAGTDVWRLVLTPDGYQATDVYYKWNLRNNSKDVVYISKDLEMPQFKILEIALQEKINIYNIGEITEKRLMESNMASKLSFFH